MKTRVTVLCCLGVLLTCARSRAAEDVVFADFEGANYGTWQVEGAAFGAGPAQGTLPGQMTVGGFAGHGLANSYNGSDGARGRLISPRLCYPAQVHRVSHWRRGVGRADVSQFGGGRQSRALRDWPQYAAGWQ